MNNTSLFAQTQKKAQQSTKNKRYYKPQFFADGEGEEEESMCD